MEKTEYYGVKCPKCGWIGSSEETAGGNPIADTGDFDDLRCPKCEWQTVEDASDSELCDEIVRLRAPSPPSPALPQDPPLNEKQALAAYKEGFLDGNDCGLHGGADIPTEDQAEKEWLHSETLEGIRKSGGEGAPAAPAYHPSSDGALALIGEHLERALDLSPADAKAHALAILQIVDEKAEQDAEEPGAASNGDSQGAGLAGGQQGLFARGFRSGASYVHGRIGVTELDILRGLRQAWEKEIDVPATPHTGSQGVWRKCPVCQQKMPGLEYLDKAPVPSGEPLGEPSTPIPPVNLISLFPNEPKEVDGLRPREGAQGG